MSIHSFQNVVSLEKSRNCMWEKYRHESKQTICIIGVLTLAVKLCKADGHFTEREEHDILNIIPHESQQKNALKRFNSFVIVDDLLATGGTANCVSKLLQKEKVKLVVEIDQKE